MWHSVLSLFCELVGTQSFDADSFLMRMRLTGLCQTYIKTICYKHETKNLFRLLRSHLPSHSQRNSKELLLQSLLIMTIVNQQIFAYTEGYSKLCRGQNAIPLTSRSLPQNRRIYKHKSKYIYFFSCPDVQRRHPDSSNICAFSTGALTAAETVKDVPMLSTTGKKRASTKG